MLKVLKLHTTASFNGKSMKSYFHLTQPGSKSEECLNMEAFSLAPDSVSHLSTLLKYIWKIEHVLIVLLRKRQVYVLRIVASI